MTTTFKHLFTPLKVGSVTLRNRIVMPPHSVSFLPGYGKGIDRVIDYHVERARGGAAMIVMSNFIMPQSWHRLGSWGGQLSTSAFGALDLASEEALIPEYRRLAEGIHGEGARFVAQLNACGRQYWSTGSLNYGLPMWAPSALPCPRTGQIPKAMDLEDIAELEETFAISAANIREAGGDGIELFAAQGYLLSEFLSPHTNRRTDHYGGSLTNRMRFLLESLERIRKEVGRDFVIGVRMNGSDAVQGGLALPEALEIAKALRSSGLVDYLNVSGMTYEQYPGWIADMTAPEGMFTKDSAAIRQAAAGLPVCVASRIGTPQLAEKLIAEGKADLIGMVRALISDPELPNKAMRGDVEDIRICTYSNQSCSMGQGLGRGVGCIHNTAVGKEAQIGIGRMTPAKRSKRVIVIGGGPGGMAAARVAAERGHAVTLYEKEAELGGQNRMISMMSGRRGFSEITRWQQHRLRRLNVNVQLSSAASADIILAQNPDAVVIATGSVPRRTGYSSFRPYESGMKGADLDHVVTVWDVFNKLDEIGKNVLLIDEDPHLAGAFVAEHLSEKGRNVTLVTPNLYPARELSTGFVPDLYRRLKRKGVAVRTHTVASAIERKRVRCLDRFDDEPIVYDGIDTVVLSMGNDAEDGLYRDLKSRVAELYPVGDCVSPRKIEEAILDGERAGWMI